jgi:DNA-binding response OmpR family regulator
MFSNPKPSREKTVLLVEDDVDARFIYATTLAHEGYTVIEATSIQEATEAVHSMLPDVVVLDCRLPDGDGLSLLSQWGDSTMARVPVIVVTAHRERQDVEAALFAGADAFVPKPCSGSELAAHIDRALRAKAPARRMGRAGR